MKKFIPTMVASLLACLFIYVFYRTDKTLVNRAMIAIFSNENYQSVKASITSAIPLPDWLVYSLPEGLWVFCITICSGLFYIRVGHLKVSLVIAPIALAVTMELFQLWHFTNGRFDWMDIGFAGGFWMLGAYLTRNEPGQRLFETADIKTICCVAVYAIVYLAHVCY